MSAAVADSAPLVAALRYADAGLAVFPAWVGIVDGAKKVRPVDHWDQVSSTDPTVIVGWDWRGASVCVDTGKSDLVVVDIDGPAGATAWDQLCLDHRVAATWIAHTPRPDAGAHWYYRADPNHRIGNSAGKLGPQIDVRGDGGFVIAPPSSDARGVYRWGAEGEPEWAQLPIVPQFAIDKLTTTAPAPDTALPVDDDTGRPTKYFTHEQAKRFIDARLAVLAKAEDGTINTELNNVAMSLGHLVPTFLSVEDATAELHKALERTAYDARTWKADPTIRSGLNAGRTGWMAVETDDEFAGLLDQAGVGVPNIGGNDELDDVAISAKLPNLPEEFWATRASLQHIRAAAHSRCVSADVVLHACLARLASIRHHETGIDTGLGVASLNVLTLAVGPSGTGKSSASSLARDLIEVPFTIGGGDGYRDVPIGSGEGLAEMFMGTRMVDTGEVDKRGEPKLEKRRCQVRHNAYVYVDEGEQLLRMGERSGATIMTALRSAWVGEVLGQANASEETTRIIPAGSYALGIVVGLQPSKAEPLFSDAAGGTPQRCLFAATTDPSVPDEPVEWPGVLDVPGAGRTGLMSLVDEEIRRRLRADHIASNRGTLVREEMDSHQPLHLAKLAGLLAMLEGRDYAAADDWELAETVWDTSRRVRDGIREAISVAVDRENAERARRDASRQVLAAVAKADALDERAQKREDKVLESAARSITRKVVKDGSATLRTLTHSVAGKHRKAWGPGLVVAAVEFAAAKEWVVERGESFVAGPKEHDAWIAPGRPS